MQFHVGVPASFGGGQFSWLGANLSLPMSPSPCSIRGKVIKNVGVDVHYSRSLACLPGNLKCSQPGFHAVQFSLIARTRAICSTSMEVQVTRKSRTAPVEQIPALDEFNLPLSDEDRGRWVCDDRGLISVVCQTQGRTRIYSLAQASSAGSRYVLLYSTIIDPPLRISRLLCKFWKHSRRPFAKDDGDDAE
jgi:hypothetical protein